MNKTVRFIVLTHGDDDSVINEETAQKLGITDAETLNEVIGSDARWCSIDLYPSSKQIGAQIDRDTYVADPVFGPRKDDTLLSQKRAANMIACWTGFAQPFSEQEYLKLGLTVSDFVDAAVLARMYPSAYQNPAFFEKWSQLLAGSDSEKK